MNQYLIFTGSDKKYPCWCELDEHVATLHFTSEDIPARSEMTGFKWYAIEGQTPSERYIDFTTVYRYEDGIYQLSDDGSIYIPPEPPIPPEPEKHDVVIAVQWDDNDDELGLRPTEVELDVYVNGILNRHLVLDESNEWKHTYFNVLVSDIFTIVGSEVEGYESAIGGTTITYTIPPMPQPSVEEAISEIYDALSDLDERVYVLEEQEG